MADGSSQVHRDATVRDILGEDGVLVALCCDPDCGAEAVILRSGSCSSWVRSASLARLEDALRCSCGARRGRLAVRPFWGPRPARPGGIFLFVA